MRLFQCATTLLMGLTALSVIAIERSIDKDIIIKATPEQAWRSWTTRASAHEIVSRRRRA